MTHDNGIDMNSHTIKNITSKSGLKTPNPTEITAITIPIPKDIKNAHNHIQKPVLRYFMVKLLNISPPRHV